MDPEQEQPEEPEEQVVEFSVFRKPARKAPRHHLIPETSLTGCPRRQSRKPQNASCWWTACRPSARTGWRSSRSTSSRTARCSRPGARPPRRWRCRWWTARRRASRSSSSTRRYVCMPPLLGPLPPLRPYRSLLWPRVPSLIRHRLFTGASREGEQERERLQAGQEPRPEDQPDGGLQPHHQHR